MSNINIAGLVNNISEKNTIYTPIIEAIVNSIQSIEINGNNNGKVYIRLKREQLPLGIDDDTIPKISSIEIEDNGIGFNDTNRESFDTLYTDQKVKIGGKGFGRFMFLKYFNEVKIDSTYIKKDIILQRTFSFLPLNNAQSLIEDEKVQEFNKKEIRTIITLDNIKEEHTNKLEKKLETVARILVEKLLPYFIDDSYKCPQIILEEKGPGTQIVLNDFFNKYDEIKKSASRKFTLNYDKGSEEFEVKIFKIYYSKSASSVILTAHNRAVTSVPLYEFIPEFKEEFFDTFDTSKHTGDKNYSIKAYVLGTYLNKNVSLERDDFHFTNIGSNVKLIYPISKTDIESHVATIVEETFKEELKSRKLKKLERIRKYIDSTAPWHKSYFNDLDFSKIPYQIDDTSLEGELQKQKFNKEQVIRTKVEEILKDDQKEVNEKIEEIYEGLTELGKGDLAHYVVLRRAVLDVLNKSLQWNKDKKFEKEKVIHKLIFPMNKDTDHLEYEKHNLWILDERLSFHEYLASDKPLNEKDSRPDILIFNRPIAVRHGEEPSNPITIFEFKRPQREEYDENENPLDQIVEYIEKIRSGNFKNIDGRDIKAASNTPAYGFLVCDITPKIREFCKKYSLTISPDKEGYYGYQSGYGIYLEVISFDKLIKDAELRNKIFFKKLKLE